MNHYFGHQIEAKGSQYLHLQIDCFYAKSSYCFNSNKVN